VELQRLTPGEAFAPSAATWEAFRQSAKRVLETRANRPTSGPTESTDNRVLVRNDTQADVVRFGVLGIDGVIVESADHLAEFCRPLFKGVSPQIETHGAQFCIVQEPILVGKIGRAILSGETVAKVNIVDVDDVLCGIADDDTAKLVSGFGPARILVKSPAETGEQCCWVRLGEGIGHFVAKTTSEITARSSETVGSGTVDLYRKVGTTLTSVATGKTVYNWAGASTASGVWGTVKTDSYGIPWFDNEDCP
jgi:hypothetical protein